MSAVSPPDAKILLTAAEAYPEFEAQMLDAQDEVNCGFRIFDPWTQLVSDRAKAIGRDWFDLVTHTLKRGVSFKLLLTDFDPVARPEMHRDAWTSLRVLLAAGEASGRPDLLKVRVAMHPARAGLMPRLMLWPKIYKEHKETVEKLNELSKEERIRAITEMPFLRPMVKWQEDKLSVKALSVPQLFPATHHQKLAVFDRRRLYIGGLDLNDRRFDTLEHDRPSSETWHDVQILVEGQAAIDAHEHLETCMAVMDGRMNPPKSSLLRTMSARRRWAFPHLAPRLVLSELSDAHLQAARRAENLIYLETQYFRDRELADHLAGLANKKPDLSLIIILPAAPDDVAFENDINADVEYGEYLQSECMKTLRDGFGDRVFLGAPAQRRRADSDGDDVHYDAPIIYLHAKVSIFDDREAIVSSANLNGRSLKWDTEIGLRMERPADLKALKQRCFEHWLGQDAAPEFLDIKSACASWSSRAKRNAGRNPESREGFILPYDISPSTKRGRNLPGVPEEMF
ncbi:phospholipase D-like domain-containing protein [Litoreibacter arenae]|uniref:phospholipase D-like domain-containing protein n=1 Tax=Litoreibacter arenae TaxID=491388 RepID=UPI0005954570|nr:phospholipase D-like domain-containing protein [Litoreibacter arenae]